MEIFSTLQKFLGQSQILVPQSPHSHSPGQTLSIFDPDTGTWRPIKLGDSNTSNAPISVGLGTGFGVLTWNIDFAGPRPILQLQATLSYLEELLSSPGRSNGSLPTILLLQEVHTSCLPTLLSNSFIRDEYCITDTTTKNWDKNTSYGTLTLVPKSLGGLVTSIFRIPFPSSEMGRDFLYVDLDWPNPSESQQSTSVVKGTRIRIGNTHLESLAGHGDRARPVQMESIAKLLSSQGVGGGLVGGDMNAISTSDAQLPEANGLYDAWVALEKSSIEGEREDEASGHTWGYQPPTEFPPGRLDKILYNGCLKVESLEKVGVGLMAGSSWVSDHYGLFARVRVVVD